MSYPESKYFSTEVEIADTDLDKDYRHLHHAAVVKLLETGRLRLLESRGKPQSFWILQGYLIVVTKITVEFLKEIVSGKYLVSCNEMKIRSRKVMMKQEIIGKDGQIYVEADIDLMFIDATQKKLISPPKGFTETFST